MEFDKWLNECLVSIEDQNGPNAVKLLFSVQVTNSPHNKANLKSAISQVINRGFRQDPESIERWTNFLTNHTLGRNFRNKKFEHFRDAYKELLVILEKEIEDVWFHAIIQKYSKVLFSEGNKASKLDEVFNCYRKLMGLCQMCKPPNQFRAFGLYHVLIMSFKVLFRLNKLQSCPSLLRAVESEHAKLPPISQFPKAHQVEFKYYQGRFCIYEQEFEKAEQCLDYAFRRCHSGSIRNKRILLLYLVPVKLWRGKFPTPQLLSKYKLPELETLMTYLKQGNVGAYSSQLTAYQDKFIQQGTFIMMEMLKLLAYRNLFKRTHFVLDSFQVPLSNFLKALQVSGVTEMDMPELECVLSNLIYKGWVKGYVSSTKKVLVLSKQNPFPKLN